MSPASGHRFLLSASKGWSSLRSRTWASFRWSSRIRGTTPSSGSSSSSSSSQSCAPLERRTSTMEGEMVERKRFLVRVGRRPLRRRLRVSVLLCSEEVLCEPHAYHHCGDGECKPGGDEYRLGVP